MTQTKILTLVGGISQHSLNKQLFGEITKHYKGNLTFSAFDIASLPFFSQDLEQNPPAAVKDLKKSALESDAILFITPEYNRSIPGVLKNAIDWGSRPYGNNCWDNKVAAIMGASIGATGTFGAQQHLRNVCSFLNMHVMSQPEFYLNASISMQANGLDERTIAFIQNFFNTFEEWIKMFK